jgi:hypothetical protein
MDSKGKTTQILFYLLCIMFALFLIRVFSNPPTVYRGEVYTIICEEVFASGDAVILEDVKLIEIYDNSVLYESSNGGQVQSSRCVEKTFHQNGEPLTDSRYKGYRIK